MPLNAQRLLESTIAREDVVLNKRDAIIYALGVGLGFDPTDEAQLRFVYERDLRLVPTMTVVIGARPWILSDPEWGLTRTGLVHGEQGFVIHKPMPAEGPISAQTRVTEVVDKGKDKGGLILSETRLTDARTRQLLATATSTIFARADGGFGGPEVAARPTAPPTSFPARPADFQCDLPSLLQSALIYRLSGDDHALHVDPAFARAAGFDRPILHGRCTFGMAGHAILRTCCDYEPERLVSMSCRFSAPVYPGETVRTEIWRLGGGRLAFKSTVPDRDVVVLANGTAQLSDDSR